MIKEPENGVKDCLAGHCRAYKLLQRAYLSHTRNQVLKTEDKSVVLRTKMKA